MRETINARKRAYRRAHPELYRNYYLANRERIIAQTSEYQRTHRQRLNQTRKLWRARNDSWRARGRIQAGRDASKWNEASRPNATFSFERWDEIQDAYLLEHAGKDTARQIAKALGRTYFAIRRRLGHLRHSEKVENSSCQK